MEVRPDLIVHQPGDAVSKDHITVTVLDPDEVDQISGTDLVLAPQGSPAAEQRDVVGVDDVDTAIETIRTSVAKCPAAAWSLARLVPLTASLGVTDGLVAESSTFSALLASAEFDAWLVERSAPREPDGGRRLQVQRDGDELQITLDRPSRRNAYDATMRDDLLEALEIARLDSRVQVTLRGSGADFCAGGDLDEFGTATDVGVAHRTRIMAHPGARIHAMRERVTVQVHGHAVGSGIEIAAFAGTVKATSTARFRLPEVAMGLIPGAGGTVSLVKRIGSRRLLWWALTGATLDASTAHQWGLVDELVD